MSFLPFFVIMKPDAASSATTIGIPFISNFSFNYVCIGLLYEKVTQGILA